MASDASPIHPPQARVRPVIEVMHLVGAGVPGDPCRNVTSFYTMDGELIVTRDRWAEDAAAAPSGEQTEEGE